MSTAVQTAQSGTVAKPITMANFLSLPKTSEFLESTLKDKKQEFVSNLLAIADSDKSLAECNPADLMKCALNATSLNLPLNKNLGYAYVIAYKGIPSFQIGYKGIIQMAIRSGAYEYLNACEVRDGEIQRNKFTGEIKFLGEFPSNKIIGYMATLKLTSGFTASCYMSEEEIEQHALRFSKSYAYDKQKGYNSSKWSDPLARPKMAIKTVLKALLGTYGVLTTEIARSFEHDDENEPTTNNHRQNFEDAEVVQQNLSETAPASTPTPTRIEI